MTSWRDNASSQAQADLDSLLNTALGFAQQQLDAHGEFFPYAVAIDTAGQAEMIASRPDPDDEHPRSTDVLDTCIAALVSQRDILRAGAIVADVRLPDAGTDSIQVDLEHTDGHALTVLLPYMKKRWRGIEYGELQAQPGRSQIWS
ncbi:MAG: hypothetical protein GY701_19870 [Sulfitobacter sp.]|nr:hypothetical protein [Sulfitobacter sp.]